MRSAGLDEIRRTHQDDAVFCRVQGLSARPGRRTSLLQLPKRRDRLRGRQVSTPARRLKVLAAHPDHPLWVANSPSRKGLVVRELHRSEGHAFRRARLCGAAHAASWGLHRLRCRRRRPRRRRPSLAGRRPYLGSGSEAARGSVPRCHRRTRCVRGGSTRCCRCRP
ncbi:MAG: hypothetical protein ACI82G_002487 [Bradymonadia bacterium]|jgi:hypothetical protein